MVVVVEEGGCCVARGNPGRCGLHQPSSIIVSVESSWRSRRGGVVVESSSRRVFRRQYQEGYGWEAAALCDSSQLIGRVLVPGFP